MIKKNLLIGLVFACVTLIGCSSSSSSDDTDDEQTSASSTEKNVAAMTNGATVSSTFLGNESFTIDSNTATTSFWSGGADGDEIKVTFDKSYSISEIKIHTNNRSASISGGTATIGFRVFVSDDDVTYTEVAIYLGVNAPVACSSNILSNTDGTVECVLATSQSARYIRVAVLSDFATTEIYEVDVTGI